MYGIIMFGRGLDTGHISTAVQWTRERVPHTIVPIVFMELLDIIPPVITVVHVTSGKVSFTISWNST